MLLGNLRLMTPPTTAGRRPCGVVRGIERCKIFRDDEDRYDFINRLGGLLEETATVCYAWALIPNHFHLLLRTGNAPIATVMRRLLTGHATRFNRRHRIVERTVNGVAKAGSVALKKAEDFNVMEAVVVTSVVAVAGVCAVADTVCSRNEKQQEQEEQANKEESQSPPGETR